MLLSLSALSRARGRSGPRPRGPDRPARHTSAHSEATARGQCCRDLRRRSGAGCPTCSSAGPMAASSVERAECVAPFRLELRRARSGKHCRLFGLAQTTVPKAAASVQLAPLPPAGLTAWRSWGRFLAPPLPMRVLASVQPSPPPVPGIPCAVRRNQALLPPGDQPGGRGRMEA